MKNERILTPRIKWLESSKENETIAAIKWIYECVSHDKNISW